MTTKTVLHVCNYAAPYRGNFIDSLASLQHYQDIQNIYLFPHQAHHSGAQEWIDELNQGGVCAYILENSFTKNVRLLKSIIKKHSIDRIITHFTDIKIDLLIKAVYNGKKVIRFFHTPYHPTKPLLHHIRKFLWNKNIFIGVSDFVTKNLKNIFPKHQSYSIINAINFNRLNAIVEPLKNKPIVITMMGWDWKRKGVDLALQAIDNIRCKYDIVLQIVAAINNNKIEQVITDTLGSRVEWVKILPPTNDISSYYKISHIFLSPSREEAFGYAVVEAAYCENSIVLSKVDGQGELEIDSAYWFESENVDEFTKQLEKAILELNTPETLLLKKQTKEKIQSTYSLEKWCKEVLALLTK